MGGGGGGCFLQTMADVFLFFTVSISILWLTQPFTNGYWGSFLMGKVTGVRLPLTSISVNVKNDGVILVHPFPNAPLPN
jgi:hypothetical protein